MGGVVTLADGRRVPWEECGDPSGVPVLYVHGAPGSRLEAGSACLITAGLVDAGIRMIGFDRPGYGGADPQPGGSMVDVAADVATLADSLALDTFGVVGWSTGGPLALALGARLGDRVSGVGMLASFAPLRTVGLDGCGERALLERAVSEPDGLRQELAELAASMRSDPATTSLALLGEMLSDEDVAFVLRPEVNDAMMATMVESARGDYAGYTDDCVALMSDWGFELDECRVPVSLIHGTNDHIVPVHHSSALSEWLPDATFAEVVGGHISVVPEMLGLARRVAFGD